MKSITVVTLLVLALAGIVNGQAIVVDNTDAFRRAAAEAKPGDTIILQPGEYRGGITLTDLQGTKDKPITLQGDPKHPTLFKGGNTGLHLIRPQYVSISHITLDGAADNGVNIDDGGQLDHSAHHVYLSNITVTNVGPRGNRDGIKLSGLRDFEIEHCRIENWGDGGSGIDMVGCKDGTIFATTLKHESNTSTASGIQAKGGSQDVTIQRCRFEHAGRRGVNLGGSTGDQYFRPALKPTDNTEAQRIIVEDSVFIGCEAPVTYVTRRDCIVRNNLMVRPGKWVLRIGQEKPIERFAPSQTGRFERNIIVWQRGDVRVFANVGPSTKPETFTFTGNWWYCTDALDQSTPTLPGKVEGNVIGRDPKLGDLDGIQFGLPEQSPAKALAGPRPYRQPR